MFELLIDEMQGKGFSDIGKLKKLESANIFNKEPTIMPIPLVIEGNQRPFPVPS